MDTLIVLLSLNILPFLLILSLLVFVHELGHYWVAVKNGVKVEVFSIGFGRELFGWTNAKGTRWKFSLIPLGGYVKMFSDLNAASQPDPEKIALMTEVEKSQSLFHKSVGQRMAVSVAGPLANYILAALLLTILYTTVGQRIPAEEAQIGMVAAQSAAEKGGLKTGDVVMSVNGEEIKDFLSLQTIISQNPGKTLDLRVKREESILGLQVIPEGKELKGVMVGRLGISHGTVQVKIPFYKAPFEAVQTCLSVSWQTIKSLAAMITGKTSAEGLSGPIGIATLVGQAASHSWVELVWLSAFLSISLGLINLFPVPMLDGGHLLFYFIEALRGEPVSEKAQERAYQVGFALVLTLMVVATWNDLSRLKVFEWLKNLFM